MLPLLFINLLLIIPTTQDAFFLQPRKVQQRLRSNVPARVPPHFVNTNFPRHRHNYVRAIRQIQPFSVIKTGGRKRPVRQQFPIKKERFTKKPIFVKKPFNHRLKKGLPTSKTQKTRLKANFPRQNIKINYGGWKPIGNTENSGSSPTIKYENSKGTAVTNSIPSDSPIIVNNKVPEIKQSHIIDSHIRKDSKNNDIHEIRNEPYIQSTFETAFEEPALAPIYVGSVIQSDEQRIPVVESEYGHYTQKEEPAVPPVYTEVPDNSYSLKQEETLYIVEKPAVPPAYSPQEIPKANVSKLSKTYITNSFLSNSYHGNDFLSPATPPAYEASQVSEVPAPPPTYSHPPNNFETFPIPLNSDKDFVQNQEPVILPPFTPAPSFVEDELSLISSGVSTGKYDIESFAGEEFPIEALITADSDIPENEKYVSFSLDNSQKDFGALEYQATRDTSQLAKDVSSGSVFVQQPEKEDLYYVFYQEPELDEDNEITGPTSKNPTDYIFNSISIPDNEGDYRHGRSSSSESQLSNDKSSRVTFLQNVGGKTSSYEYKFY